jgi:prepilin-type N-terminal cleavage/methylation domain-containing protein
MTLKNEKGLTLIEVLGAMMILSIVVIAFVNLSGYTSLTLQKSDSSIEALR